MKANYLYFFLIIISLYCCHNTTETNRNINKKIDYSNINELDSIIKILPESKDSLFLGFVMSMSENDYEMHIKKLKQDGLNISYKKSNILNVPTEGKIDVGAGYTLTLPVVGEYYGKKEKGIGKYLLLPSYSENKLSKLTVLAIEHWGGSDLNTPQWIENNIEQNTRLFNDDGGLKEAMVNNGFMHSFEELRIKNDVLVYKGSLSTFNYISPKYVLQQIQIKLMENTLIEESNKDIKF